MTIRARTKASPEPSLSTVRELPDAVDLMQPSGNATQPLEKPRVRRKAHADQTTLLKKGPNALPVSDYPLKDGPIAANNLDLRERMRARRARG